MCFGFRDSCRIWFLDFRLWSPEIYLEKSYKMSTPKPHIIIKDLTMAYGSFVVQSDLTFTINRGDVFIIMGGSGCGKSTLLRHIIGLKPPAKGSVFYEEVDFWQASPEERDRIMRGIGVLYQKRRSVEFDDAGRKRRPAAARVHRSQLRADRRAGRAQAGAGGAGRFRGVLPVRDQRRHAEARRAGAGHGLGPRDPVFRRAVGGPGPDQRPAAGRARSSSCAKAWGPRWWS